MPGINATGTFKSGKAADTVNPSNCPLSGHFPLRKKEKERKSKKIDDYQYVLAILRMLMSWLR